MEHKIDIYNSITKEQRALFGLLGNALFDLPFAPDEGIDWGELYNESRMQSVVLPAFHAARDINIPDMSVSEKVKKLVANQTVRNIHNRRAHSHLHRLMTGAGIEYCVLKGVASAEYYPNILLRHMGDVDFYVDEKDVEKAVKALCDDGFEEQDRKLQEIGHHRVFKKRGMHFELHFEVAGVPASAAGARVNECFDDITSQAVTINREYANCNVPSPFHHGLIMLLHLQHHLLDTGIGLRHLCDWAVFANSFKEGEFEALFKERLSYVGLWKFAQVISLVASVYIGLPEQPFIPHGDEDVELAAAIMLDILGGGNFGSKNRKRQYEGMIISVAGRDGKKGWFRRGFGTINRIVSAHWPIAKRLPILYPFGWIYFSIRYLVRMVMGKRPSINVGDMIDASKKRSTLYSALELFEFEK